VFIALGHFMGTRCCACTAETDVDEDIRKLAVGQQIVVGTPRRIFSRKIIFKKKLY
jgi:superfamily II DNA/RNA helicase